MSSYKLIVAGENHHFRISFPGVSPTSEVLRDRVQEWMRARKIGIGLKIGLEGALTGSKNPEFEAALAPEDFQRRLEDLAAFVGQAVGCAEPEILFAPATITGGIVANFGLSEGYGDSAKLHDLEEVRDWLSQYRNRDTFWFEYQPEPVTLVYGGWPDGDTVGTGSEPAVVLNLTGSALDDSGQVTTMLDVLAGAFNQSRYYLEEGKQISIFQKVGDTIPGQE